MFLNCEPVRYLSHIACVVFGSSASASLCTPLFLTGTRVVKLKLPKSHRDSQGGRGKGGRGLYGLMRSSIMGIKALSPPPPTPLEVLMKIRAR